MGQIQKLFYKILSGKSDTNIPFQRIRFLLLKLGFSERIIGSHFYYKIEGINDRINIQPKEKKVKPWQVKQIRNFFVKHKITIDAK
jgi:hypothetical protein